MNTATRQESNALAIAPSTQFDLSPKTFDQALVFADYLADSDMVPKDFKGKPGNCLIAMQWGMELGMKPLQAIQSIAVINGRPSMWGDALLALVRSSPLCEYVQEGWDAQGTAVVRAKRRGEDEQVRTFSDADAKLAGLLGKQGPWTTGPKRMKQLRARAFALRDVFTDVLRGMAMAEEVADYTETPGGPKSIDPTTGEIAHVALPPYTDEAFAANLPKWRGLIETKKRTPGEIIFMVSSKATLTAEQIAMIEATVVDSNTIESE
jgi:hypothetical protein